MNQNNHYTETSKCPKCKKVFERQILNNIIFCEDCQFENAFKTVDQWQ